MFLTTNIRGIGDIADLTLSKMNNRRISREAANLRVSKMNNKAIAGQTPSYSLQDEYQRYCWRDRKFQSPR